MEKNNFLSKHKIAKQAYKEIVQAIVDLEDKHGITCQLPAYIEVDGNRFFKGELHHFSVLRDKKGRMVIEDV